MLSRGVWLSKDEEVQLVKKEWLEIDSGAADFGEPMLKSSIWGARCGQGMERPERQIPEGKSHDWTSWYVLLHWQTVNYLVK